VEKQHEARAGPLEFEIDELRRKLRERAIPSAEPESRAVRWRRAIGGIAASARAFATRLEQQVRARDWRSAITALGSSARWVAVILGRVAIAVFRASRALIRGAARSARAAAHALAALRRPPAPPPVTPADEPIDKVLEDPVAEQLRRAEHRLTAKEQRLGPERPEVAAELHLIGALHHQAGRYAEAAAFYTRSLAIRERTLGPDHPEVAAALEDLAAVRTETGNLQEAELLLSRARRIHALRESPSAVAV
jgi:tetratricopeptide (TPR) repeat protein